MQNFVGFLYKGFCYILVYILSTLKKRIYWINKFGGRGCPTAYVIERTLHVIEWIISQLTNKDTAKNVFIQLNKMFNKQHMRLATRDRQFVWFNKLFLLVYLSEFFYRFMS